MAVKILSYKEFSISARQQRRKSVIGEKSKGGKILNVVWNDKLSLQVKGMLVVSNGRVRYVTPTKTSQNSYTITYGLKTYTNPTRYSRNIVKMSKHSDTANDLFIRKRFEGPENPFVFPETILIYHHRKTKIPNNKKKDVRNGSYCYNHSSSKAHNKGIMKRRINLSEYM